MEVVVTCEHGGNTVPERYAPLFRPHRALLASHRGYDIGALDLARAFAAALGEDLIYSTTSRLLVDLNRSVSHPRLFSPLTRGLGPEARRMLLAQHYAPYRQSVERRVERALRRRSLLHLSCHTFTPVLDGSERRADVGLLFDPRNAAEASLCGRWRRLLGEADPALRVWRNYPYRGFADSLTTELRRRRRDTRYVGIQVEVNQAFALAAPERWRAMQELLVRTFLDAAASGASTPLAAARACVTAPGR